MKALRLVLLLTLFCTSAMATAAELRGTGDLGLIVERASGGV